MRRTRTKFILLSVLALFSLLALLAPSIASAEPGTAHSANIASSGGSPLLSAKAKALAKGSGPAAYAEALAKFWTPERMRAAIPADEATPSASLPRLSVKRFASGTPGKVEPTGPTLPDPTAAQLESFVPNLPDSHLVARTYGKVFFTNATDGLQYVCSATVVNSTRKDMVWTAGHCVHGGQGETWHKDWQFVPAYKDGKAPYGVWTAETLATRTVWAEKSELTEDLGVAVVAPRGGHKIVEVLGGQGIAWNFPPAFPTVSLGYPAAPPFDGEKLVGCADYAFLAYFNIIGLRCDMTGGSSGGGWLRDINREGLGYLNGLNSFGIEALPNIMFSPYYGGAVKSLYYYVVNEV
jgi:hypothetical protein